MREGDGLLGWVGECIRGQRRRLRTGHPSGRHPRRDTPNSGRIGYGPLAKYNPSIVAGATVTVGEPLGTSAGSLAFSWQSGQAPVSKQLLDK